MEKSKIIVIVGPTASGKTDLSLRLARQLNGEIITADSRTLYRGMNIGTAKPEGHQASSAGTQFRNWKISDLFVQQPFMVKDIPHWGIDIINPDEPFSVADFKAYADERIADIISREQLPIIVGGTGLYVNAVIDNWSLTEVKENAELRKELEKLSDERLILRLELADRDAVETVDTANRRRLIRAIEIVETTGKTLAENQNKGECKYEVLMLGMKIDRELLYERIDYRVDKMIAEGLVDEVRGLKNTYGCEINAMTGIGYRQICAFLDGYLKLRDATELLKRDTRHYAKGQLTWFKRDARIHWISEYEEVNKLLKKFFA